MAIATPDVADAVPGATWGRGERKILVLGTPPRLPLAYKLDPDSLVSLRSGNAWLIRLGDRLDGPVGQFGRKFWDAIAAESPQIFAAMRARSVRSAEYSDRYLATPLNMRLLAEVLTAMPGRDGSMQLKIATARLDRPGQPGWAIYDQFPDDQLRRKVLQGLVPDASIQIRPKPELPHARGLRLTLGDGRDIKLLLDQGFGAWRVVSAVRHDFRADPLCQARLLRNGAFQVHVERGSDAPMILEG